MIHYTDACIFCGQCEDACINDGRGIRLSQDWELSFFDRHEAFESIEKPLQLCERCGAVVGCRDHLTWVADRLGARAYGNPTLYLSKLRKLGLVPDDALSGLSDGARADRFNILCARCRREASAAEEQI
jgi:ferredoxin